MALYKAKFRRYNFGFKPVIKQTADVIFETNEDLGCTEFMDEMWDEVYRQNTHWKDNRPPMDITEHCWSNVLFQGKIEKIKEK